MKVGEVKKLLADIPDDWDFLFSSDEELNCLRTRGEIATLSDRKNTVVIYGFDGSEIGEGFEDY